MFVSFPSYRGHEHSVWLLMKLFEQKLGWVTRSFAVGIGLLCALSAEAKPGEHIKAGNALMKPSLDFGMEFRTNVLQAPSNTRAGPNLLVQPGFDIESKTPDTDFTLTSLYSLRKYFQADLIRADRYSDMDIGARLNLMRSGPIGFLLTERAAIRNDNNLQALHTRVHNGLGAQMAIRPGPVLELRVGGSWDYDRFLVPPTGLGDADSTAPTLLSQRNIVGPTFETEWRFFPRTAFVLDSSYLFYLWNNNSGQQSNTNTRQVRFRTGLRGRLTERLVLSILLGYGAGKYTDTVSVKGLNGLLAEAQFKYELNEKQNITLGYQKSFEDIYFTDFVAYNRLYTRYSGQFSPRFGLNASFSANFDEYKGAVTRSDLFLVTEVNGTINANDWVSFTLGTWWRKRQSTDRLVSYDDVSVQAYASFRY